MNLTRYFPKMAALETTSQASATLTGAAGRKGKSAAAAAQEKA